MSVTGCERGKHEREEGEEEHEAFHRGREVVVRPLR